MQVDRQEGKPGAAHARVNLPGPKVLPPWVLLGMGHRGSSLISCGRRLLGTIGWDRSTTARTAVQKASSGPLSLSLSPPPHQPGCCPLGWEHFRQKCLWISLYSKNWEDSKTDCEKMSSRLVVLKESWEASNLWDAILSKVRRREEGHGPLGLRCQVRPSGSPCPGREEGDGTDSGESQRKKPRKRDQGLPGRRDPEPEPVQRIVLSLGLQNQPPCP